MEGKLAGSDAWAMSLSAFLLLLFHNDGFGPFYIGSILLLLLKYMAHISEQHNCWIHSYGCEATYSHFSRMLQLLILASWFSHHKGVWRMHSNNQVLSSIFKYGRITFGNTADTIIGKSELPWLLFSARNKLAKQIPVYDIDLISSNKV